MIKSGFYIYLIFYFLSTIFLNGIRYAPYKVIQKPPPAIMTSFVAGKKTSNGKDDAQLDKYMKEGSTEEVEANPVVATEDKFNGKIKKKCMYYPGCKNEDCPYIHPTEPCPKFPKCTFGESCFYLHPSIPCKFGIYCQRPNCSYMHPQMMQAPMAGFAAYGTSPYQAPNSYMQYHY